MPIELTHHSPEQLARRRADLLAALDRETILTITLPAGRPPRRIEVVREGGRYELAGDLELFGCDLFDTIPIHAVNDEDAAAQAERLVRARWVREG